MLKIIKLVLPIGILNLIKFINYYFKKVEFFDLRNTKFSRSKNSKVWTFKNYHKVSKKKLFFYSNLQIDFFPEYIKYLFIILNLNKNNIVVDYGGAFGIDYFLTNKLLKINKNVNINLIKNWLIFDDLSVNFDPLNSSKVFHYKAENFLSTREIKYNLFFTNSTIQYIENLDALLLKVKKDSPEFIILSRVYISKENKFKLLQISSSQENIFVDCVFHTYEEIDNLLSPEYNLFANFPLLNESFEKRKFYKNFNKKKIEIFSRFIIYKKN